MNASGVYCNFEDFSSGHTLWGIRYIRGYEWGSGIHNSLKKMPISHLIKMFAYSLRSIRSFIKNFDIFSLIIKSYIPHCSVPILVPHDRSLCWFFTHWLTNSLNDNIHVAFNSILLCPKTSPNSYDKMQEMPFCFPCACVGLHALVF